MLTKEGKAILDIADFVDIGTLTKIQKASFNGLESLRLVLNFYLVG